MEGRYGGQELVGPVHLGEEKAGRYGGGDDIVAYEPRRHPAHEVMNGGLRSLTTIGLPRTDPQPIDGPDGDDLGRSVGPGC